LQLLVITSDNYIKKLIVSTSIDIKNSNNF